MKTVIEYLDTLIPAVRTIVIKNIVAQSQDRLLLKVDNLEGAISNSFDWNKSKEGFQFWEVIAVNSDKLIELPQQTTVV